MKFIENLDAETYKQFWKTTPNNHFMQSYEWGQICQKNRHQTPYYVGLENDNGKLIATALLLKRKLFGNICYFYSPRGFTINYTEDLDANILQEFTIHLKNFLKNEKAIYLKLDPPIKYQTIDLNGNPIEGENNYKLYNKFLELGYVHKGFNKLYERNQPRYTFRTYFNKYKNFDEITSLISKTYMKRIKKSYNYDLEVEFADNIDGFYDLIKEVALRDNFNQYAKEYYQNVYNEFKKNNLVKIFNIYINPSHLIEKFDNELKNENKEEKKQKLLKDIEYFKNLTNKSRQLIASQIVVYSATGSWTLYLGSNKIAENTCAVNRVYYEVLKDSYDNNYEYLDLFGTVGDPKTKYKNLAGIFEHKRMLGGEYIEFIGEFDLVNKPLIYKILPFILKIYRKIRKK